MQVAVWKARDQWQDTKGIVEEERTRTKENCPSPKESRQNWEKRSEPPPERGKMQDGEQGRKQVKTVKSKKRRQGGKKRNQGKQKERK